ncbi:MAG: CPBP family intramembrane metalloprotease [Acidobacteriales bacterium]|nr:CPBP family intramembrane metalloprotease [Terriglobales bacterium]
MEPEVSSHPEVTLTPTPAAVEPPRSGLRNVFVGRRGIRAGWRFFLFLVLVFGITFVAGSVIRVLTHGAPMRMTALTPAQLSMSEGLSLLVTCLATWIMMRIERGKWGRYGLPLRAFWRGHLVEGAAGGFLAISAVLLVMFLLHGFSITGVATHGTTLLWSLLAWSLGFLLVGLAEEFAFRGYAQYSLSQGIGFWPAAVVMSGMFGLAHWGNNGETKWGLLSVVCFGLLFCLFLRRMGNLWWAVGFHAGWDWGQTFFYGVPDSGMLATHNFLTSSFHGPTWITGGSVGPEASVFTPVVLGVTALLFSLRHREVKYRPAADFEPERQVAAAELMAGAPVAGGD